MRTNALKKHIDPDYVQDNHPAKRSAFHMRIVRQAEASVHLSGNTNGPDLDWFENKYGGSGDFA